MKTRVTEHSVSIVIDVFIVMMQKSQFTNS